MLRSSLCIGLIFIAYLITGAVLFQVNKNLYQHYHRRRFSVAVDGDKAAKTEQCKRFSVRKSFPRQWGHAPLIFNPTVSTVAFGLLFCTETGFYAVVTDIILLHKHSRMHQNPILWNIQLRFFVWGRGRAQPIHQTLPGEEREYGLPTSYRSAPGLERPPPNRTINRPLRRLYNLTTCADAIRRERRL